MWFDRLQCLDDYIFDTVHDRRVIYATLLKVLLKLGQVPLAS